MRSSIRGIILVSSVGLFLSACAAPPPVPWETNASYLAYALKRVSAPNIDGRCFRLVPQASSQQQIVMNDNYPWDRYTKLSYTPSEVLALTAQTVTSQWGLMPPDAGAKCEDVRVSISHLAHDFGTLDWGGQSPDVCIILSLALANSGGGKHPAFPRVVSGYGAANPYTVWWVDRASERLVVVYNRAAYMALLRALSNGIRALTGQTPLEEYSWPKCYFKRGSTAF